MFFHKHRFYLIGITLGLFLVGILAFEFQIEPIAAKQVVSVSSPYPGMNSESVSTETNGYTVYLPIITIGPWPNPFGIESNLYLTSGIYNTRMIELGAGWARLNDRVSWRALQPNEGDEIKWELLDKFESELRALKAARVKPIVIVDDYPRWATIEPNSCSPIRADKFSAFANFVHALVERYRTPEFDVRDWELGNEVDVDPDLVPIDSQYGCWGEIEDLDYYGGDYYGEMVKVVGQAIKLEDPNARVWIGGLMIASPDTQTPGHGKPERFLRGILVVGAAPYFDVLPYHAHTGYYNKVVDSESDLAGDWIPWGGGVRGKAVYLRQIMSEYGVDKPLFVNEIGVGCASKYEWCNPSPDDVFYEFQADMLVRIAARVISEDVDGFIWYTLNGPGWREMGLLDGNGDPRYSFTAYQELIEELYGKSYISPVVYHEDVEAYIFGANGKFVHVAWAKDDNQYPILIPQDRFIEARTRDGAVITPVAVGTDYQITVGFSPVYIERQP
ncbi:MAG: hypothetical protein ABIG63_18380 [Chloroflexota bacterium]